MRILDKYILKSYITTFLVILFSFFVLFLVVDISDRLPRLLRKSAEISDIIAYFVLRIPYLMLLASPVIILLSGLFVMNNLSKYSESIAIRAAGISIFRMITPLIWFGLFFSIFIMFFGDFVLPKAEEYRNYIYTEKIKNMKVKDNKMRSHINYLGQNNNLYYIGFFDGYRNTLKTIDVTNYDEKRGVLNKKITATSADWKNGAWQFENCDIRIFKNGKFEELIHYDSTTIAEIDVKPIDFIKSAKKPISMNYFELKEYINRLKKIGEKYSKELVELNLKISFPFANLIILLFSVPLVSTMSRSKGRGMVFAIGLLVCFLYLSALRICQSLGYNEVLSPFMAAWLPNIVFAFVGIIFVVKAEV